MYLIINAVFRFKDWFLASMSGVQQHLLRYSEPSKMTFIGEEKENGEFYAKMVSAIHLWDALSTHLVNCNNVLLLVTKLPINFIK